MLAGAVALAYGNALTSELVHDDAKYVALDRPLDATTLVALFNERVAAANDESLPFYRPLAMASIALDTRLFGGDTRGHHATSIVLHLMVVLLLYLWLLRALPQRAEAAALIAALWFAVHPVHTEAVDSIYNRAQILCALFTLAALWSVWRFIHSRPAVAWGLAALSYLLGLFCKESVAPLPLVLVALLVIMPPEQNRPSWRRLAGVLSLAIALIIYLVLRRHALSHAAASVPRILADTSGMSSLSGAIAVALTTVRDALRLLIWPHPLRAAYGDYRAHQVVTALVVMAALVGASWRWRKQVPEVAAGFGLFVIMLLLPLARLFLDGQLANVFAERHLYLPALGLCLVLARALAEVKPTARVPLLCVSTVVCLSLAMTTRARTRDWRSNESLWLAEVQHAPRAGDGWMQLTTYYIRQDQHAKVAELCAANLEGQTHPQFFNNCAVAAQRLGRATDAERLFRRSLDLGGGVTVHANFARLYSRLGRTAEAQTEYQRAIDLELDPAMKHVRRGEMIIRTTPDRLAEARAEFEAALAIAPNFQVARNWLSQLPR